MNQHSMTPTEYQRLACVTESIPASINFGTLGLHASLALIVAASEFADGIKKIIFYGKSEADVELGEKLRAVIEAANAVNGLGNDIGTLSDPNDVSKVTVPDFLADLSLGNLSIRLLHAALGHFTEAGEKLNALGAQFEGRELDVVNYIEEMGDQQWYTAIETDELRVPLESVMSKNIAKLQDKFAGRYKSGGFTAQEANHRDLGAERQVLERQVPTYGSHLSR